jgi:hypothetical protein
MSSVNIGENFLAGLRAPHYANGRLLTAEDLQADQEAMLARIGYTGAAAGAGIVSGFEVAQVANNLKVAAGLGINRKGQAVRLIEAGVELSLTVLPDTSGVTAGDGRFTDCNLAPAEGGALVAPGAYLLVVSPVSQLQGSVSVKTINTNTTTCASRWEVEGVQFKAIQLTDAPVRNANNAAIYRNLLAHWCFGTDALKTLPQDPFSFPARYSGLDLLSEDDLGPCDLPLAVFFWEDQTLRFVDQWPARRRVVHAFPAEDWHALIADRRVADAQARFLQFQAQIEEMRENTAQFTNLTTRYGGEDFRYLPPVGFLPIIPSVEFIRRLITAALVEVIGSSSEELPSIVSQIAKQILPRIPTAHMFRLESFFGPKLPRRIGLVDRETVEFRLNRSWYDEPLDFTTLPDVTSAEDDTIFEVLIIADELNALITGLVKVSLGETLSERDVTVLGNTFRKLGATVAFSEATGFQRIFGRQRVAAGRIRMKLAPSPVGLQSGLIDLFNERVLRSFIQTAKLPPQYAMFVKTVKPTRWIERDFGER